MSLITAEQLSVSIGKREILTDLTFSIPKGTFVGLLGPNGSGKTTLLKAISGLLPYRGTLQITSNDVSTWKASDLSRILAFVRQSNTIAFDFTVAELVLLGRTPHKSWLSGFTAADRTRMRQALEDVGLTGYEERIMTSLSGGEAQRALLAQAFMQEAQILLLDEPTSHLDIHHQFAFLEIVRGLVAKGCTIVAVFHDLELAARFTDTLFVLQAGQLVADGPTTQVLTEKLIANVFSMEATCSPQADGTLAISFHQPL